MPRIVTTPPAATAAEGIRTRRLVARVGRRPAARLRPLPPRLRLAAGRSGLLLRPRKPRRADRLDDLRAEHRLLHRPDREEAAQPVLSRHGGALVRHARLQPGLHVLPELDDVAIARTSRRPAEAAEPEAIAAAAKQHGCHSVAFTYNDPIIWAEYAIDTARACRAVGVKTVAVTSGYISRRGPGGVLRGDGRRQRRSEGLYREFYREYCGGRLQPVLDTLRWLVHQAETWVEITNLIIPGANDSPDEIRRMCQWIAERAGAGRAAAFFGLSSRLQADRSRATPPAVLRRPTTWPARSACTTCIRATSSTPSTNIRIAPAAAGR